jgi:hypothetical protein
MASDPAILTGGCACGQLRFRMQGPPIVVHACHCRDCQRETGSAFAVNVMVETDRLTLEGAGAAEPLSSDGVRRCGACGTRFWGHVPALGKGLAFVKVGVFDDPAGLTPHVHCYTRSKHPWVALPAGAPAFEADYDGAAVLSAAAMARIAAARS